MPGGTLDPVIACPLSYHIPIQFYNLIVNKKLKVYKKTILVYPAVLSHLSTIICMMRRMLVVLMFPYAGCSSVSLHVGGCWLLFCFHPCRRIRVALLLPSMYVVGGCWLPFCFPPCRRMLSALLFPSMNEYAGCSSVSLHVGECCLLFCFLPS